MSDNAQSYWSQPKFGPTLHSVQTRQTRLNTTKWSWIGTTTCTMAIPAEAASVWWERRHCHLVWLQRRQLLLSRCLPSFKSFWTTGCTDTWYIRLMRAHRLRMAIIELYHTVLYSISIYIIYIYYYKIFTIYILTYIYIYACSTQSRGVNGLALRWLKVLAARSCT